MGIEPTSNPWQGLVLPLNHARLLPTRILDPSYQASNAQGGTRTRKPFGIRPSNVRVCQFRHLGI
jgi:hypothetical protein